MSQKLLCPNCYAELEPVSIEMAQLGTRYTVPRTCPQCKAGYQVQVDLTLFTVADA